jgi:hypothetical protein
MNNIVILSGHIIIVRKHNASILVETRGKRALIDLYMDKTFLELCEHIVMHYTTSIVSIRGYIETYENSMRIIVDQLSMSKEGKHE